MKVKEEFKVEGKDKSIWGKHKIYKLEDSLTFSNLMIVSMIPGDRKVAGCFNLLDVFGGIF